MSLLTGKNLTRSGKDVDNRINNSFSPQRKSVSVYLPDRDFFEDSTQAKIEPVCWRRLEDYRETIYTILCVLTGGLLSLFNYRYSGIHMYLAHSTCSPMYAEIVQVRVKMISDNRVKTIFAKVERQMIDNEGIDGKQKNQSFLFSLFHHLNLCMV